MYYKHLVSRDYWPARRRAVHGQPSQAEVCLVTSKEMIRLEALAAYSTSFKEEFFAKAAHAGRGLASGDKAKIITLNREASAFLWQYQNEAFPIKEGLETIFSLKRSWSRPVSTATRSRKWLAQQGVPLDATVWVPIHPDLAYGMSWKLVIKHYRSVLQLNRQRVWDPSLDWCLYAFEQGEIMQWSFYQHRINEYTKPN